MRCARRGAGRAMVEVSLRAQDSNVTVEMKRKEVVLRSYAYEFHQETLDKTLVPIEQAADSTIR